jgi:hypothetical protein
MLGAVHSWHVVVRGSLLALVAAAGVVCFLVGSGIEEDHYEADKVLVQSVEAQDALWVERPWWISVKSNTTYVELEGQRVALDRSPPLFSDHQVGDAIKVVIDPDDESHIVAADFDETYLPADPIDHGAAFFMAACLSLVLVGGGILVVWLFFSPEMLVLTRKLREMKLLHRRDAGSN